MVLRTSSVDELEFEVAITRDFRTSAGAQMVVATKPEPRLERT